MELDILKIFVLTVHPCTVFIHVLLLGVNISHIHVSLLVCFQFPSYEQTAIVVYKFNVTIFKVFLYYMLNFAGEKLHIFFFKEHFKDP